MANKIGAYICNGCGIGQCLNTGLLADIAGTEPHAAVVRTSDAFCLEDAQLIRNDVESGAVDAVVIAACSPRVNTDVFSFGTTFVERVNIREQVAWSHVPGDAETQALAEDYLRMGMVRARKASPPQPFTEANERTIIVVGGGAGGLSCTIEAARAGFRVVLVERAPRLGGFAARLHRQFPQRPPYRELESPDIDARIREVQALPNVTVLTSTEVTEIGGQPGQFSVRLSPSSTGVAGSSAGPGQEAGGGATVQVGAIVLATGWSPALTPVGAPLDSLYGLGRYPNVVTSVTLEEMAASGNIVRPSDGKRVSSAAIVLCDGPNDEALLPYGGNVSSLVALKQALYIRQADPDALVYMVYEDMQTPGQYEYFYRRVQEDPGVLLSRGEVRAVAQSTDGRLTLDVDNTVIGGSIRVEIDLLVLSMGMVPSTLDADAGLLNLQYLQGKDLPTTKLGYADSHFICFPYETRRTGIYSAGAVRQPMDLAASVQDGAAAALKAIQSILKSSAGAAVHPRVGDLSYPVFFMQNCTSCGRCTQECPFGALELDEKNHPVLSPNRCRRCGICMGACPVQIISFNDYSVDMLASMTKAVEIPDDERPRILAFACENDAYPALDMAGIARLQYSPFVRVLPVRCLGSVNSVLIADAVSHGFDGVALLGCKPGDDYQCHFIRGSELLGTRMDNVRETLDRLFLESERVRFMEVAISDSDRIPAAMEDFVETIRRVGPNPMKGF